MAVAPAMAAPVNPAASLSVSKSVRSGSTSARKSDLAGPGIIIAIAAAAAVIAGIVVIALIAILLEYAARQIERRLAPWAFQR